MLRYAFNTNGAQSHRLPDLLDLMAEAGYAGVALTLDHMHFDPFAPDLAGRAQRLGSELRQRGLGAVIETGARFLLDPRQKHEPTLLNPAPEGRARRVDFLTRALDVAAALDAEAVSFWAGVPKAGVATTEAWRWLEEGVAAVVERAQARGVVAALEPEPEHLVATVHDWERLHAQVPGITFALDVGHCLVTGEIEPEAAVRRYAPQLGTVAVEDMRRGEHVHRFFGEGDVNLPAILGALTEIGFEKLVSVELSRESHRAHEVVPRAIHVLREAEQASGRGPVAGGQHGRL